MRLQGMVVSANLFIVVACNEANAQSVTVTAGLGRACHGSDGSVCHHTGATVIGTVGVRPTSRLNVGFRVSRFDNAFTGDTVYYAGPEPVEVARLRHDTGRTMKYGAEIVYYPAALTVERVSTFIGGGAGVRTFRHRTTCAFGACNESGPYATLLGAERVRHGYLGFVVGVDASIVHGLLVRGTVRLDDFPSEVAAAQMIVEVGYRIGRH